MYNLLYIQVVLIFFVDTDVYLSFIFDLNYIFYHLIPTFDKYQHFNISASNICH